MDSANQTPKIAFITGITGQTASYLCEFLLDKNYVIYGLIRRASTLNTSRIEHLLEHLNLYYGDLTDMSSLQSILLTIQTNHPTLKRLEVYNLGAMSHVKVSFEIPLSTTDSTAKGTLNLLEAIRMNNLISKVRFYQAGSSEMFGKVCQIPQTEKTPFHPRSPYAVAKQFAHSITINYREAYNLFACNGILFNHESPRRTYNFVSRKITLGVGKIIRAKNEQKEIPILTLGNLESRRDWSHAKDMVRGIWMMLQQDVADDYVLCSGYQHSVREFVEICFEKRNIHILWKGFGEDEVGYDAQTNQIYVKVDKKYFRPAEVEFLLGSSLKAYETFQWSPQLSFDQLITDMLDNDCPHLTTNIVE